MDSAERALYESISEDVLGVLRVKQFFALLDDLYCPAEGSAATKCKHDCSQSIDLLKQLGFDDQEREDVIGVLRVNGGCCDCEILYNVAPESRLRERYWKARHADVAAKIRSADVEP